MSPPAANKQRSSPPPPPPTPVLYAKDVEQAVLAAMLADPDSSFRIGRLRPEHFYDEEARFVMECITARTDDGQPVDTALVSDDLVARGWEPYRATAYVTKLVGAFTSSLALPQQSEKLIDLAVRRAVVAAGSKLVENAFDRQRPIAETLDAHFTQLVVGTEHTSGLVRLQDATADFINDLDKPPPQELKTGLTDLDDLLHLAPGQLVTIGARPSMGKTSFMVQLAKTFAQQNGVILFCTLETTTTAMVAKMLSETTGIPGQKLRWGQTTLDENDWTLLLEAANSYKDYRFLFDPTKKLTISQVVRNASRIRHRVGRIDAVFIDYLQLMSPPKANNRQEEISALTRDLKLAALNLDTTIFVAAQLNRDLEKRADRRPILADLRESGAIEQDSDIVIFLYRDQFYDPATTAPNIAEVITAKQRDGETGTVALYWHAETTSFRNLVRQYGP